MSVLWLESFIINNNESSFFSFQSTNILIYLNMLSCFCFLVYSLLYNMDLFMQRAPSKNFFNLFFLCKITDLFNNKITNNIYKFFLKKYYYQIYPLNRFIDYPQNVFGMPIESASFNFISLFLF